MCFFCGREMIINIFFFCGLIPIIQILSFSTSRIGRLNPVNAVCDAMRHTYDCEQRMREFDRLKVSYSLIVFLFKMYVITFIASLLDSLYYNVLFRIFSNCVILHPITILGHFEYSWKWPKKSLHTFDKNCDNLIVPVGDNPIVYFLKIIVTSFLGVNGTYASHHNTRQYSQILSYSAIFNKDDNASTMSALHSST